MTPEEAAMRVLDALARRLADGGGLGDDEEYRSKPYNYAPVSVAYVNQLPMRLIDGVRGLEWRPRTLYLSVERPGTDLKAPYIAPIGNVIWCIEGLHRNGVYRREFATVSGEQVEVDISTFDDIAVTVLSYSFTVNGDAPAPVAIVTNQKLPAQRGPPYARLPTVIVTPGEYAIPWGAEALFPGGVDGGFAFRSNDAAGSLCAIPRGIGVGDVGTEIPVAGTRFVTTVASYPILWRIRL